MTDVEIKLYHKVVIHEILESEYDHFVSLVTLNKYDLRWIDGILFLFLSSNDSEEVLAAKQQGIRNWELFHFTRLDIFTPILKDPITNREAAIIDNSNNEFVKGVIDSLKEKSIISSPMDTS